MKPQADPPFLSTDELSSAIDSLLMAARFSSEADNPYHWKWVAIALQNALYGFCVHAVGHTNYQIVMSKKRADWIVDFNSALCMCRKRCYMEKTAVSKPLPPETPDEREAIRFLHEVLRNGFMHFQPKAWVILFEGLPECVRAVCGMIDFLVNKSFTIHLESGQRAKIEAALQVLRNAPVGVGSAGEPSDR